MMTKVGLIECMLSVLDLVDYIEVKEGMKKELLNMNNGELVEFCNKSLKHINVQYLGGGQFFIKF